MAPSTVYLPNGTTLTVTPVFGGLAFRVNELNTHHNVFPPGWTINLHTLDCDPSEDPVIANSAARILPSKDTNGPTEVLAPKRHHSHRFRVPSLRNDHLFISSISNPSSNDFRPPSSPTRQIAMMLWATLYWYFHQSGPSSQASDDADIVKRDVVQSQKDWRININREGIFTGKHLLPKLERMGLIASEDSSVGLDPDDGVNAAREAWNHMFVSQRSFWQLDPRIYLFSLSPTHYSSPYPSVSPATSRPASPNRNSFRGDDGSAVPSGMNSPYGRGNVSQGPFASGSHLPTFYPPSPPQYTATDGRRHPIRPKPPRQGEIFYTRFIPSLGQYLSFRVASLSQGSIGHRGPVAFSSPDTALQNARDVLRLNQWSSGETHTINVGGLSISENDTTSMSDVQLLHKWMNDTRVAHSWAEDGPMQKQEEFLKAALTSKHSIPVIGCFDGKPFGYFEIYWVKEDRLAGLLDGGCGDWDRGLHVLVGESEFRGPHRVKVWLSALIHYCLLNDLRTNTIMMEPNVDNAKIRSYCEQVGFYKQREVTFPHKQSNLMITHRDVFDCPEL